MKETGPASVTIYDVAAAASVSIKTVSRVLNREGNVRAETRAQVLEAVAALNYRPNVSARRLAGSRGYLLGLMFHNPSVAYVSDLQLGAAARCRQEGYHLVVEPFVPEDGLTAAEDMLRTLQLDGMILTPPVCDDAELLDLLDHRGTPYVRIAPDRDPDRAARIGMDDREAARQLTRHLIDLGHRRIGFVRGPADHGASHLRYEGYVAALEAHGLSADPVQVQDGDFTFRSGQAAAERLLAAETPPTAVFASNDDMALGVMTVAARRGLDVPGRLSVAGFDDTPTAQVVWPQLTTVRQPVREMSAIAADLLITRSLCDADGRPVSRTLDFELMLRGSTGALRAGG